MSVRQWLWYKRDWHACDWRGITDANLWMEVTCHSFICAFPCQRSDATWVMVIGSFVSWQTSDQCVTRSSAILLSLNILNRFQHGWFVQCLVLLTIAVFHWQIDSKGSQKIFLWLSCPAHIVYTLEIKTLVYVYWLVHDRTQVLWWRLSWWYFVVSFYSKERLMFLSGQCGDLTPYMQSVWY